MIDSEKVDLVQNKISALNKVEDIDNFLHQVAEVIARILNIYFVGIYLADELGEYMVLKAGSGIIGERYIKRGYRVKISETSPYAGQVGSSAYYGEMRLVDWLRNNITSYQNLDNTVVEKKSEVISDMYFRSPNLPYSKTELYLPLQMSNRVIGVMELNFDAQLAFTLNELAKLQSLANEITFALI